VNTKLQWSNERLNSATNFTKPKKNNEYFWGFQFLKQKQKEIANKSKIFLGFSRSRPKIASKANQRWKTKEPNREKQWKYFWSFCVLQRRSKDLEQ
jgi:hypothetical protein